MLRCADPVTRPLRLVLAGTESLAARCLELLLEGRSAIDLVGCVDSGHSAAAIVADLAPDVVVVDLRWSHALEFAAAILVEDPVVVVIARADSDDVETASVFLGLGVTSVIPREITPDGFVSSLEAATAGVRIVPRWLQVQAVHRPQPLLRSLTPEERRLWSALSLGSTNESIARQLFVSERTLKRMTRELFRKLQVANRVGAATLAGRVGLPNTCDLVDPSETGLPHIRSVS